MPISRANHISPIIEELLWLNPHSILDVGCGFGLFGVLFRAFTDIRRSERHSELYNNWTTKIDGIEMFEPYRSKAWEFYTNIYVSNALTEIDKLEKYDFVYCGDVIEHLTKEDGHKLIKKLLEHTNKWVHIATPSPAPKQDPFLGNPNEEHISSWTEEDFKIYKYEMVGMFGWGQDYMMVIRLKNA
jgi:2-polyprenyl-3-methyl-5-hydroxy-6-metoxy-1,4-benzoquinol methylase